MLLLFELLFQCQEGEVEMEYLIGHAIFEDMFDEWSFFSGVA